MKKQTFSGDVGPNPPRFNAKGRLLFLLFLAMQPCLHAHAFYKDSKPENRSIETVLNMAGSPCTSIVPFNLPGVYTDPYIERGKKGYEVPLDLFLQQLSLSGTITDTKGNPIPFVNVLIKGTTIGTASDEEGRYSIKVRTDNVVLIFNSLGYAEQEISTRGKTTIDVVLLEEVDRLEEVIVTAGYNTIERRHLASSIEVMELEKIESQPLVKLEEAFSGTMSGITLLQGSNLPGDSPGTISIRGLSTLQNASPLVVIDGIEQSLSDIDPNQVESITVLKDAASASMYGSRGANGVILITTNRGTTGEFKVNVHSWLSVQSPLDMPDFVNAVDYMQLNNEARGFQDQPLLFTQEDIDRARSGDLPNVNWLDIIMQQKAHFYNTSASISGGGGVGTFNLMLGYLQQSGLNPYEGSQRYNARFNTNVNIGDRFVLMADFYAHRLQTDRLLANDDGHGLYQRAWSMNPSQQVFYEDDLPDHYILYGDRNPLARMEKGGERNFLSDRSTINLRPRFHITHNLHLAGNVSYMINKSAQKHKRSTFKFFDGEGKPVTTWGNAVGASQGVSESQITARALVNYEKDVRKDFDKIYLVAGTELMNFNFSDFREITKASFFSKLNYSFKDRYLLEATVRQDGSSKFAPGYKWGFFPSASMGWNVHNEGFMKDLAETGGITNFKIRASYGRIGNENVPPYLWQERVNFWGWTLRVPNEAFSWETQTQQNVGFDLTALQNKLNLTFDTYTKKSEDLIYSNFPVPPLTGSYALTSAVNIGEVENRGWEVSASWSDRLGDFSYRVQGTLFDNQNKVLKAGHKVSDTLIFKDNNDKIWYRGIGVDNYYGYQSDGYFQNQAEIDGASAVLPNTIPGDIRYVDRNKDGIISDKDKVNLGDPFPHMNYSINLTMNYRNWDFGLLGQGVGRRLGRLNGLEGFPVLVDGNTNSLGTPRQYYMDNRWTPNNPNSRFPRVWTGTSPNAALSDVWLGDASFFRIKSIQLGYTVPATNKKIRNIRVYFNARDVFTFTNWEGLEPERDGGNGGYPRMASFTLGAKLDIY
ncbi:SusC/RagA family TonB-linked outer membrane protein [Flavobacteriaceae bacterium 3-367]|uniref:SusC/RagA family TonB-linked outer membrane protein n=1 Tax=Eudoraea algarum TaxID=3417568 RepID=UPI003270FF4B